jgi:hypothetical protein
VTPDERDSGQSPSDQSHADRGPSEEEAVRRLLAAAGRTPEPLPDDVGTRLDDVLAGLVAERRGEPGPEPQAEPAPVADLAARRRRRWAPALVAAATVSVVALGVSTVMQDVQTGSQDAAGGRAGVAEQERDGTAAELAPRDGSGESGFSPYGAESQARSVLRLRSGALTTQVQQIENVALAAPTDSSGGWKEACVRPPTSRGDEWLPVRLDGQRGVLVLRAPVDGRRAAEVFTCMSAVTSDRTAGHPMEPAATTTVRAR